MMTSLAKALAVLEEKKAEINQKIAILEQAIKIYSDSYNKVVQKEIITPKPVRYIKLDDVTLKKKRGRPAKVLYIETPVTEKREKLTLDEKIMRILRKEYRFLTANEITEVCMQKYSEKLLDRNEVEKKIENTLSNMLNQRKVVLSSPDFGRGENFWGFEEWLNSKGDPHSDHRFVRENR